MATRSPSAETLGDRIEHAIEARTDVQGTSDMAMSLTAAGGGALAGVIVGALGYPALATFAALLAAAVVVAGTVTRRRS